MKAAIVHITDHAILRWKQRVSDDPKLTVYNIISIIRKARQIKKNEIMPFMTPRHTNVVYAIFQNILFIMEPITINEYNLVTIITKQENFSGFPVIRKTKKIRQRFIPEQKKKKKKLPARNKRVDMSDD